MALWGYTDLVSLRRQKELLDWPSFSNIKAAMMLDAKVCGFVWERGRPGPLANCSRPAFLLGVTALVYDGFFNSPVGYRAQFALSPARGEAANAAILHALSAKLIASFLTKDDVDAVLRSLAAAGAKIWIDEDECQVQQHLFDETPEIDFPPWGLSSECTIGLRAPVGTRLVVLGAWQDETGALRQHPGKLGRSMRIHLMGYD